MTWFKLHHELPGDYKLSKFSSQQKWAWIVLLCLASSSKERGTIPTTDQEGIAEHCDFESLQDFQFFLDKLRQKGMIEPVEGGIKITNWADRQRVKPSDEPEAVKARVDKHRGKSSATEELVTPGNALQAPRSEETRSEKKRKEEKRVDPVEEIRITYNKWKPRLWVGAREIGEDRLTLVKKWIKTYGRAEALDRLEAALRWINRPNEQFWLDKPGKFSLLTLGYKGRLYEWSEAWYELQHGNTLIGVPSADAQAAISQASNAAYYGDWVQETELREGLKSA
jgi:hypothetical protein